MGGGAILLHEVTPTGGQGSGSCNKKVTRVIIRNYERNQYLQTCLVATLHVKTILVAMVT